MNKIGTGINMTHYSHNQSDLTLREPNFLELNFTEATAKKIKLFGFFFQHAFLEVVLPLILYFALKGHLGVLYSTIICSVPNFISSLFTIVIKRRFEPLPMLIILTFFIGLGLSLGFNDAKLNQIQGPVITGAIGMSYLVTIRFKKPTIYYLSRPWVTMNDPEKIREFDQNWQNARFKNSMRTVSIVWGIGLILQAGINTILIFTIGLDLVIILSNVLTFSTIGLLVIWSFIYKAKKINVEKIITHQVTAY